MAPVIKLRGFSGEQPRIIARLMPEMAAQRAVNTRLDDGGLTPMRQSADIAEAGDADWLTIYKHGDDWLGWDTVVNAAPGPVATDRLYYTGDGVPKMRVGEDIYPLALAPAASALTATLGSSGSGDVVTRIYVYTWVTGFGEESEPCPASNAIDWQPGHTVTLSGFASTPSGRNITHQRIYRSQTGQSGTYFYLIAERAASTGNFSDTVAVDAFQEPLPSASWNPPPDDLAGLTALTNGMMAAFKGKQVYFCEPYRPHAWPEKYVLTTNATVVGLGAMGTSVVVLTTGQPHLIEGSSPETMRMTRIEQNFPCINARGIVDLGFAIAFPSNLGVVVATADGSMRLASANIFNRDDWLELSPTTMVAAQIDGRYLAFYSATIEGTVTRGALLLDLSGQSFLIRVDAEASAVFFEIATGYLYYLERGTTKIRQLDAPNADRLDQYWKSKQFVLAAPENFGVLMVETVELLDGAEQGALAAAIAAALAANAALIAAGSIGGEVDGAALNEYAMGGDMLQAIPSAGARMVVNVYADKRLVASVTRSNVPVRLPAGFLGRIWEVDAFGNVQIETITMAKTVDDLKSTP